MLISERIYKYMEARGMSQMEFACKTGISQSTISDWRRKGTNPSADKIMLICDVLEISPYELLAGTETDKYKEYNRLNYMIVDKQSKEFELLELYQNLDIAAQQRLEGYIRALSDMQHEIRKQ